MSDSWRIPLGILGYGGAIATTLSLVLMALGSWLQKAVPLVMSWACLFLFVGALGRLLREVFENRDWHLFSLWRDLWLLGCWCFDEVKPEDAGQVGWAFLIVSVVCATSLVAMAPRVRAVRVVS